MPIIEKFHEPLTPQDNLAFRQFVGNIYQEQAARIIQRWFRKKHASMGVSYQTRKEGPERILHWEYTYTNGLTSTSPTNKVFSGEYKQTLNTDAPTLSFFRKSSDAVKAKVIIRLIQEGKYLEALQIDNQPESERALLEALRVGDITLNQLATLSLLSYAKEAHEEPGRTTLRQYFIFDATGPHNILDTLDFDSVPLKQKIQDQVRHLPANEQSYFTLHFSRRCEIALLYDLTDRLSILLTALLYPKMQRVVTEIYKNYIKRAKTITQEVREQLLTRIDYFFRPENTQNSELITPILTMLFAQIKGIILAENPEYASWIGVAYSNESGPTIAPLNYPTQLEISNLTEEECCARLSAKFFAQFIKHNDWFPQLEISPDYDSNNPNSPLFCMILPTISALNEIQLVIQGERTVLPYFTAGAVSEKMSRDLDEKPEAYRQSQPSRAVELDPTDIQATKEADSYPVNRFMLTVHDLYHCWRTGHIPYKPILRHLRQIFAKITNKQMSPIIWLFTDMDFCSKHLTYPYQKRAQALEADLFIEMMLHLLIRVPMTSTSWSFLAADIILSHNVWLKELNITSVDEWFKRIFANQALPSWMKMQAETIYKTQLHPMRVVHEALKKLNLPEAIDKEKPSAYYLHVARLKLQETLTEPQCDLLCQWLIETDAISLFHLTDNDELIIGDPTFFQKITTTSILAGQTAKIMILAVAYNTPNKLKRFTLPSLLELINAFGLNHQISLPLLQLNDAPSQTNTKVIDILVKTIESCAVINSSRENTPFAPYIFFLGNIMSSIGETDTPIRELTQYLTFCFQAILDCHQRFQSILDELNREQLNSLITEIEDYMPNASKDLSGFSEIKAFCEEPNDSARQETAPRLAC